jgi:hypothetical protein
VCYNAEESEEEMMVPEPCSFTAGLHFLGMSLADAEEEYLREVFDRADPSFLACEGAKEFLKSTTAMRVFVPNN